MPRYRENRERMDKMWVMGRLMLNETQRYIDMVTTDPPPLYDAGAGSDTTFLAKCTIMGLHATASFIAAMPTTGDAPHIGFLSVGVTSTSGRTMFNDPGAWPLVLPFLPGGGTTTQVVYTAAGGTRSMRKAERGQVITWDYHGAPTAPWTPETGKPKVIGLVRFLIGSR